MVKIKNTKNERLRELYQKVDKIFNNSFAYLTTLDYYDLDDFYIEEELNELPGYIQSIINDCDTFDKKENSNQSLQLVTQNAF